MRDDTLSLICTSGKNDVKGCKLGTENQLGFVLTMNVIFEVFRKINLEEVKHKSVLCKKFNLITITSLH